MEQHGCGHTWREWEYRSYWLDGASGDAPVERSWVRHCTTCSITEYRRLPAGVCPDNSDHTLRGWGIPPH